MRKVIYFLFIFVLLTSIRKEIVMTAYTGNTTEEFNAMGLKYFQEKQYDLALESYQKALDIDPNNTVALYNIGGMYLDRKEFDKAIEKFEKVASLKPNDGDAYYNLAVAYYYSNKFNEAIKNYDKSQLLNLSLEPERTKLLGRLLEPTRYKEIDFKYSPLLDKKVKEIVIKIKGVISESDGLIRETLAGLEPWAGVSRKGIFQNIEIELLRVEPETEQLWILRWDDNTQKKFRVTYSTISGIPGTNINIKEE